MINNKSYIHIWWWMLNELHLSGTELLVYATIFSFTNGTEDHCFHGSASYLAERAWITRRGVEKVLIRLIEKWLIERMERNVNNVKFVDYFTKSLGFEQSSQGTEKNTLPPEENDEISEQSSQGDGTKFPSYNSVYNSNIYSSNEEYTSSPKISYLKISNDRIIKTTQPLDSLPSEVVSFLWDSYEKYSTVKYQIDKKQWKYIDETMKDYNYLCKEYWEETVKTVLAYIKQDDFRKNQIQSISKLRKKNKDWIPYIVVMMEKIQNRKPKVIDLDNM